MNESFLSLKFEKKIIWKNLNVDKFSNGDPIQEAKTNEEWVNACKERKPVWAHYDNDEDNGIKYGKLYNWYAINDKRGLAPKGWHISTEEEWLVLEKLLNFDYNGATKLKSTEGWNDNRNGTNKSGFNALPGGSRLTDGRFMYVGEDASYWTSTQDKEDLTLAIYRNITT